MRLYLIRHGITEANAKRLYCGSTDLPLSEAGREALRGLHYAVSGVRFLTSGMRRADETLKLLFGEVPYETESRFREMDFGDFEMCSYRQLKEDPRYQAWITGNNEANIPPNGESGLQMKARVLSALKELREDTVLVTHGGVIAAIMAHRFPEEQKNRYEWQPKNGCGYLISGDTYRQIP